MIANYSAEIKIAIF